MNADRAFAQAAGESFLSKDCKSVYCDECCLIVLLDRISSTTSKWGHFQSRRHHQFGSTGTVWEDPILLVPEASVGLCDERSV